MSPNSRGGQRPGAGRKRLAPDGLIAHNITLSAEDWAVIEEYGAGNRSAGVRVMVATLRDMFVIPSSQEADHDKG